MKLAAWGQSDPGRKRERNEDSYLVDPAHGLIAVADGMGGHQGGAIASRMAVEFLEAEVAKAGGNFDALLADHVATAGRVTEEMEVPQLSDDAVSLKELHANIALSRAPTAVNPGQAPALEVMHQIVRRASAAIFEASWIRPELRGMGTTLTALLLHDERVHLAHAGDSRCYLFRDGQLRQVTEDHSWIAEQLRTGAMSEAEARSSKFRHVITKSIGFERHTQADLKTLPAQAGDCYLLCSDGMSNYVDHGELERLVAMTWYRKLPSTLIELANSRGGDDNITVVVGLISNAAS